MKKLRKFLRGKENVFRKKFIMDFIRTFSFLRLTQILLGIFVFMMPFQIDILVYISPIFKTGNFNPFGATFIYLNDFVLIAALISCGIAIWRGEIKKKITYGNSIIAILMVLFFATLQISVFFAQDKVLAFNLVLRFAELYLFYFFIINKIVKLDTLINIFIATISVQSVFAIWQYLAQGPIGLSFLGEVNITPETYGVAKIQLIDEILIRPYGTFPHANILAGFLVVSIFLTYFRIKQKEFIAYPLLLLQMGALVLTFSRGAFMALFIGFLIYISIRESKISFKYILFGLIVLAFFVVVFDLEQTILERVLFADTASLNERIMYFNISKRMMMHAPFGIGLGNFTFWMSDFTSVKLAPWLYQPVHNTYMLMANEIGVFGMGIFGILLGTFVTKLFIVMKKVTEKMKDLGVILISILVAIFVLGLFDHYLFSLYHGQVLTFLLFGFYGKYIISAENHS